MNKITLNIELKPFIIPNYVIVKTSPKPRQEGVIIESPKYHLSELDKDTLSTLCDEFRHNVFLKAGIEDE